MRRAGSEDGIALVSAIIVMFVLVGLGFGLVAFSDAQQQSATFQQSDEAAYAVAEAALNAQIFQLSTHWPSSAASAYPASCNPTNAASTAGCPDPNSMSAGYPPGGGPATCPANGQSDAWASPQSNYPWSTYVRDDGGGTSQLFDSSADSTQPRWDAGGQPGGAPDGAVWVRAVGVANCHTAVVITKVSAQYVPITLPAQGITANGFATSNKGAKIIIDTEGTYAQPSTAVANPSGQPGPISMRCTGLTANQCKSFRSGQVVPDTTNAAASPSPTLTATELAAVRSQAIANGTWFGAGSPNGLCPTSMPQLAGSPTYVDGPCTMKFQDKEVANSPTQPGFLVINNGTLDLAGSVVDFGVVYAVNAQGTTATPCDPHKDDVVTIEGNAEVQGAIIIDGGGTACFGSSGNGNNAATNFVFDPRGFNLIKGWGGAAGTPNSFRVLPQGQ